MSAAVLVLARTPAAGGDLERVLGERTHAELQEALTGLASTWAAAVAPSRHDVLVDPPDATAAVADAFARHGGPLLVASTAVPRLGPGHAAAALADLADGADASFGPRMDGGWYLVALAAARPPLLDLAAAVFAGPDVMPRTLAAARELALDVGLLRMERAVATPSDARALAADPLTPPLVRKLLIPQTAGKAGRPESVPPLVD